jgi:hypothetical protein
LPVRLVFRYGHRPGQLIEGENTMHINRKHILSTKQMLGMLLLVSPIALGGCMSFTTDTTHPPQNTTVVVPPTSTTTSTTTTVVCSNGAPAPCE